MSHPDPATGHDWFDPSPITMRKPVRWPGDARLAVGIVVSLEHYEMLQAPGAMIPGTLPGGMGRGPYPDFRSYSIREYGNRIGVFRVMETLARHGIRATAAIDGFTATHRPAIVKECLRHGWEVAAHGQAVTQVISEKLSEAEERSRIAAAIDAVERATGQRPVGWHGPEYGESKRTPGILADLGMKYVLDWPNDELPYAMRTPSGPLTAVPMLVDLDDVFAHWYRKLTMARWQRAVADALDRMLEDGKTQPRMLVLNLHPWLIGAPWRISYLDAVLADLKSRTGVWIATAGEIAQAWRDQQLSSP
ncbi:MAG: polysaccharide deacetylase family protein [Proteobacteria bacterium]|nr:polysaccharide deacetylase family protein [Pseudomonadota bacterium]